MKEATDEHEFPRMTLFWHSQNSVIHSEEWLVPPAFGVPNAGLSVFYPWLKFLNSFFKQSMSSLGKIIGKSPFTVSMGRSDYETKNFISFFIKLDDSIPAVADRRYIFCSGTL